MAKIHYGVKNIEKIRGPTNGHNSIWGKTGHLQALFASWVFKALHSRRNSATTVPQLICFLGCDEI